MEGKSWFKSVRRAIWLLPLPGLLGLFACQDVGKLVNPLSPEEEAYVSDVIYNSVVEAYGDVLEDPDLSAYIDRVAARVLRAMPEVETKANVQYRYLVLNSGAALHFSVPDGRILLCRGLLQNVVTNEEQLAAVLAHEIAHVEAEDVLAPMRKKIREQATLGLVARSLTPENKEDIQAAIEQVLGLNAQGEGTLTLHFDEQQELAACLASVAALARAHLYAAEAYEVAENLRRQQAGSSTIAVHRITLRILENMKKEVSRAPVVPQDANSVSRYRQNVLDRLQAHQRDESRRG